MTQTYLLRVTVPHPSLLPLAYAKLGEIGVTVKTVSVPPAEPTHEEIEAERKADLWLTGHTVNHVPGVCPGCAVETCPTHGTPMEPIPEVGMVCPEEGCR